MNFKERAEIWKRTGDLLRAIRHMLDDYTRKDVNEGRSIEELIAPFLRDDFNPALEELRASLEQEIRTRMEREFIQLPSRLLVVCVKWASRSSSIGKSDAGYSLHIDEEAFAKRERERVEHAKKMLAEGHGVPGYYEQPDCEPYIVEVDEETFRQVAVEKNVRFHKGDPPSPLRLSARDVSALRADAS